MRRRDERRRERSNRAAERTGRGLIDMGVPPPRPMPVPPPPPGFKPPAAVSSTPPMSKAGTPPPPRAAWTDDHWRRASLFGVCEICGFPLSVRREGSGWTESVTVYCTKCEATKPDAAEAELRRNVAIRIAREYLDTDQALSNVPGRLRRQWEDYPIFIRTHWTNVIEDLIARGVIKP